MASALRVYIETSVWSMAQPGQNPVLRKATSEFLTQCRERIRVPYHSLVVLEELKKAARRPRGRTARLLLDVEPEELALTAEVESLARRFVTASVLTERHLNDARHVACAFVHELDALGSWDYRHVVHSRKVEAFKNIASNEGYEGSLEILTPMEILECA